MDRIFQFRPGVLAVPAARIGVFLVAELGSVLVKGELFMQLCPQIDGCRSVGQLVQALHGRLGAAEVLYGIDWLAGQGHLIPQAATTTPGGGQAVQVVALGQADPTPFAQAVQRAGGVLGEQGALRLVIVDDYLDDGLAAINRQALQQGQAWMLAKPGGLQPWWGPVFMPGTGPCWDCLATRLRANRPVQTFLQRRGDWPAQGSCQTPTPTPAPASRQALIAELAALSLAGWAGGGGPAGPASSLCTLDPARLAITRHGVRRRPQCPACGAPALDRPADFERVALRAGLKRLADEGGHRSATPAMTLARLADLVSPITGIVSSLGPLPQRPALRPVYAASYLVCPVDDAPAFDDFHRSSLGKGKSAEQAQVSALCEALERWSAIAQGDEPKRRAAYRSIAAEALRPDALLNFSPAQYAGRLAWNQQTTDPRRQVPLPADDDLEIAWTAAWSLTHHCRRYLPSAYCYSHFQVAAHEAVCSFNPNGHAAGNCLEEAILQGFLELAERDAVALWWYSRALRPGVDLASFDDPYFTALVAHYASIGWALWVLDISTDLQIPCFVGLARSQAGDGWCIGFGSHLDASVAVQRALTEVNQLFGLDPSRPVPWSGEALAREDFLWPAPALGQRQRADYAANCPDDLRDEVLLCVERARHIGLETLVLDLTRADAGLSVAKVVVPGLRHFWPRFGPGRLYDAPAAMGWVPHKLTEAGLNPAHLFL